MKASIVHVHKILNLYRLFHFGVKNFSTCFAIEDLKLKDFKDFSYFQAESSDVFNYEDFAKFIIPEAIIIFGEKEDIIKNLEEIELLRDII